jgi:hypothetical protein
LEFCAKKINHGRKPYKAIYTLDGHMLENMKDLVKFCEDSLSLNKKRVIIREPSIQEKADGPASPAIPSPVKLPMKSSLLTKNKATFLKQSENQSIEVPKSTE